MSSLKTLILNSVGEIHTCSEEFKKEFQKKLLIAKAQEESPLGQSALDRERHLCRAM
jgi:hypothetical protein